MTGRRTLHLVVPDTIDDPGRPSGGNTYDRRLAEQLTDLGWRVRQRPVGGAWPSAEPAERRELARALAEVPEGAVVVVDGLVAAALPEVVVPAARRTRLVVLVHMLFGPAGPEAAGRECSVLRAAAAVVATSDWARRQLVTSYGLDPARVAVARPGVDPAERRPGSGEGADLLCVGAVTPAKGHDVLVAALARVADLTWRCSCVGSTSVAPDFASRVQGDVRLAGLESRVALVGPRGGRALDASYAAADLLVLPTRGETFGMVVTEALARGLPVLASEVGGVPEALGTTVDGRRPGLLTPPDDAAALAGALRRWLTEPALRHRLRDAALVRRAELAGWSETARSFVRALEAVAA